MEFKKAAEPLSVLSLCGLFTLAAIASGFLNKLGADGFDHLKRALKVLLERKRLAQREHLLVFQSILRLAEHLLSVEIIMTNPTDADVDTFFDQGLRTLDRLPLGELLRDTTIRRVVLEFANGKLEVKFAVRQDAVPCSVRLMPRPEDDDHV